MLLELELCDDLLLLDELELCDDVLLEDDELEFPAGSVVALNMGNVAPSGRFKMFTGPAAVAFTR